LIFCRNGIGNAVDFGPGGSDRSHALDAADLAVHLRFIRAQPVLHNPQTRLTASQLKQEKREYAIAASYPN
jgi:hypothetical protein